MAMRIAMSSGERIWHAGVGRASAGSGGGRRPQRNGAFPGESVRDDRHQIIIARLPAEPFAHAIGARDEGRRIAGTARPDLYEVDATLWVPLSALRDEGAVSELLVELGAGQSQRFPSLQYREYVIWGLTHGILTTFLQVAEGAGI